MKTLAAILTHVREPLQLCELEIPALRAGQVLVEIEYSSICHTQINEIRGLKGEDKFLPHTLGHEGFGVVRDVGPEVTKVRMDDPVVVTWLQGNGKNVPGTTYRWGERTVNSGAVSTFMRYAVVSENRVVCARSASPAPQLMPLLGCAVPTGVGVVLNNLQPKAGSSIAIWGLGGIGLCAVMGARLAECDPIIAVDIQPAKWATAKTLGATHFVDARETPVQQILELTKGIGVDFAIDAAGNIAAIEAAYHCVRKGGGRLVVAGNPPAGEKIAISPMDLIAGKQIAGTWGGEANIETDVARYSDEYARGRLPLEALVTHTMKLTDINVAIDLMASGQSGRIILQTNP